MDQEKMDQEKMDQEKMARLHSGQEQAGPLRPEHMQGNTKDKEEPNCFST
jgi:hypothetical protein